MKRILRYIPATVLCAAMLAGCSENNADDRTGQGYLEFTVGFDGKTATRAETPGNCTVKVATADGKIVYEYTDLADIPAKLWLTTGDYIVVAEGGTKVVSGWDAPFYKGSETFTIKAGETTGVAVVCMLQNALFTVGFDASVTDPMSGYSVTLSPVADDDSHDLVFDDNNIGATGYVMPSKSLTSVGWSFTAEHVDYGTVAKIGTIAIEARKKYELTFKYTSQTGIFDTDFTITVIEEPVEEIPQNIAIFQRPKLTGVGFDLAKTQLPADSYEIAATASSEITGIVLTGSVFGGQGIDLLSDDLTGTGVYTVSSKPNAISIFLTSALFDKLGGSNEITITVTDAKGKTDSAKFKITASGIDPIAGAKSIWATFANVSGTVLEEGTNNVRFAYRPSGGGEWEYLNGTETSAGKYTARIVGLLPSSAYEVALEVNGLLKGDPASFTTDAAPQLPNAGFEEYHITKAGLIIKNKDFYHFYAQGGNKFWDTGNEGSTSVGNSVTTSVADARPGSEGTRSAKLQSAYVAIQFAAGNIYAGNYAGTSGTNGKVNFGREFTARPSALTVWFKATPGTVDYAGSGAGLVKGDTDKYQIYVALTDWNGQHQVNTGEKGTFINYDTNPGIIAFGEISGSEMVGNWTKATINLKYRSLERVPKYIVVSACASMYGDYFTGSTTSVMYVDDFELVYDENIVLQD